MKGLIKSIVGSRRSSVIDWARVVYDLFPLEWRYGPQYQRTINMLAETEHWDLERLEGYQNRALTKLIHHAYENVPYYNALFNRIGMVPGDIRTGADLKNLPFLTKAIIRTNKKDLLAKGFSRFHRDLDATSGSTGNPLDFFVDRPTRAMEIALAMRHLQWLGYNKGDKIAEIKEDMFADANRLFRYYPGSKILRFSLFRANEDKLRRIVEKLVSFRPKFIRAFPSSLALISRWMERHNVTLDSVAYVITSSEKLYESIETRAQRVFHAPVIDHYGQNEKVATAFQCAENGGYHIQMEQAVVELHRFNDGQSEVVGTSLQAYGMPFIRYRTGDLVGNHSPECSCGRKHPLISDIVGRQSEYILTPEGDIVAPVALDYAFYGFEEIKRAQIEQPTLDTLIVRITPWSTITSGAIERLRLSITRYVKSPSMKIRVEVVDQLSRTKRGKRPFIISRLDLDEHLGPRSS